MTQQGVTGDALKAAHFLRGVRNGGPWSVTSIHDGALNTATFAGRDAQGLYQWIEARLDKVNLYWWINPTYSDPGTKARLEDISYLERLHVDLDPDKASDKSEEVQRGLILALLADEARLKRIGLPGRPSLILDSGGGYWAFWTLVEPLSLDGPTQQDRRDNAFRAGGYNKWIGDRINAELGLRVADDCHNVDRIARLPYTINFPSEKKRARGRRLSGTDILEANSNLLYRLEDFECVDLGPAGPCHEVIEAIEISGDWEPLPRGDAWEAVQVLCARYPSLGAKTSELILLGHHLHEEGDDDLRTKSQDGRMVTDRNRAFRKAAISMIHAGIPLPGCVEVLKDPRFGISEHMRFPANRHGKVSRIEVRGRALLRATEWQVKKAAQWVKDQRDSVASEAEALDGATVQPTPAAPPPAAPVDEAPTAPPTDGGMGFPPGADYNAIMREMNRRHVILLQEGGKTRVLSWERTELDFSREVPVLQTFEDFRNRYMHVMVQTGTDRNGNPVQEPAGKAWLKNPHRRQHLALRFDPTAPQVMGGYLNMWRGWAIEPTEGDWSLMRDHVVNVLANGNAEYADYIIKWAAWSLQNPGEPAEVALVFKGRKGAGKGTFARALKRLFGQHGLQVNSPGQFTGRFNRHLRDCCLLYADEALVPGDKAAESILKGLITEPELTIEGKGADLIQARNRLHVIMASNEDWVVPAGMDERRFAIFAASEERIQSRDYFRTLYAQMEDGGMEAMLYDLLNMELEGWHPRDHVPHTEVLQEQKDHGLSAEDQFILAVLDEGTIPGAKMKSDCTNIVFSRDTKLGDPGLFTEMRRAAPKLKDLSDHKLGHALLKWGCERTSNGAARGWTFPPLNKMRASWEKRHGPRNWPPVQYWDDGIGKDATGDRYNGHNFNEVREQLPF